MKQRVRSKERKRAFEGRLEVGRMARKTLISLYCCSIVDVSCFLPFSSQPAWLADVKKSFLKLWGNR